MKFWIKLNTQKKLTVQRDGRQTGMGKFRKKTKPTEQNGMLRFEKRNLLRFWFWLFVYVYVCICGCRW